MNATSPANQTIDSLRTDVRNHQHPVADTYLEALLGRPAVQFAMGSGLQLVTDSVVLVTGAAGSIGSELVQQLLPHCPREIVLLDQAESGLYNLLFTLKRGQDMSISGTTLTQEVGNIVDRGRMRRLFDKHRPDIVFHAAAYKHVPLMEAHPYEAVSVNGLGTKVMADMAVTFGVKKFVMISTDKAVNPTNVMGATKRLAELYVQSLNETSATAFIITRFGNVLGSSGSVVPLFQRQIAAGGPVTVTHPDVMRYFMTTAEACRLVLEAAVMGSASDVFVFDMGAPVRIADLARQMIQQAGFEVGRDIALLYTGLRPGEKLYEERLSDLDHTQPTNHPKIRIARLTPPNPQQLSEAMHRLEQARSADDDWEMVAILKEIIPEYISNNSLYEALDGPMPVRKAVASTSRRV